MSENRCIFRVAAALAVMGSVFCLPLSGVVTAGLRVELLQVKSAAGFDPSRQPGRQNASWSMNLELKLRLSNDGDESLDLQGVEVFLESGGALLRRRADEEHRFPKLGTMEAGESVDCTAGFVLTPWPAEP
ncbi:MAG: hypothetical protein ACKPHU_24985, partial [Planctomycetaceae bacterium]